jgi:hypothetical protein
MKAVKTILALTLCAMAVFFLISTRHQINEAIKGPVSFATPGDNESYADKIARYRAGAENAARTACTNEVVGLRGIIALDVQTYDNNFKNWTANATVEYINHIGGVDRTNIELTFDPGYTGVPTWFKKTD